MVSVDELPRAQTRPPGEPPAPTSGRGRWWWVPGAITVVTILSVIVVTLSQLHPSLLLTNTTTTGGDTGAHVAMPKFMETLLSHGRLTGWDPGWYDGFPLYTFYFTLPDLFIAVAGWIAPYDIVFKLGTVLGSVLLPICAWACGRFFRLRAPIPTLLAAATLPFLFDYTFTIYGGNLFSTLAGEYAFSFSLSLAILFLGLFACAIREGRYRAWAALALAGCVLSHIVPGFYALGGAVVLTALELLPARWGIGDTRLRIWRNDRDAVAVPRTRTLWWAVSTVGTGLLLTSWWLLPFGLEHAYSTSMDYQNLYGWGLFFPEADTWALLLAGVGALAAIVVRSRFGITVTVLGVGSAVALVLDPQADLYNVRLLPLWFISIYLMAAWAFGAACIGTVEWWARSRARRARRLSFAPVQAGPDEEEWTTQYAIDSAEQGRRPRHAIASPKPERPPRQRPWPPAAVGGAVLGLLAAMLAVVPPFVVAPSALVHAGPNEVTNWSTYNYIGYQGQTSYPEYHAILQTMDLVTKRYGCGREMWEYSASENRFGTPEALMLLPYWTNGCVDSMEGLLFESSATTPYHFINQAELSEGPSEPEVGLPYGPVDVALGVQHLQLLGVKYFMAETPQVEAEAAVDPDLQLVAKTGPWSYDYQGAQTKTTWQVYLVKHSSLVTPLRNDPVVLSGVKASPASWLGTSGHPGPSMNWYLHPSRWNVELAQSGPASWPRTPVGNIHAVARRVPATRVTAIRQTDSSVSFHVSRVGTPVLVKVSYFPNWHATGADGPWRVTPNLMVVVPTSHDVSLTYGMTPADHVGQLATLLGLVALVALAVVPWWHRRRQAGTHETNGTETV
jgi:hypothetical protein